MPPLWGSFPFVAAAPWHFDYAQEPRIYPSLWGFPRWVCFIIRNAYVCIPQVRQILCSGMQWSYKLLPYHLSWSSIYFRLCIIVIVLQRRCMLFSLRKAVVQYGPAEGEKRRAGSHSRSRGSGRSTSIAGHKLTTSFLGQSASYMWLISQRPFVLVISVWASRMHVHNAGAASSCWRLFLSN